MNFSQSAGPLRVLVVDDNHDAAHSLCLLVSAWGHMALMAYDATAAWATAVAEQPDVVLLDLGLPGVDGWELARRLRADPALRGIVLIAITGHGRETDRLRSAAVGIDQHLLKPVEPELLRKLLAAYELRKGGTGPA